jgi:uncharacterized membrane protein YoaK (UPF0700 family)
VYQASLLALIAGYADTIGFLRYGAFAGLMTGNTIMLGHEVATSRWALAGFHATIIVMFLAGVMLAQALLRLGVSVAAALGVASLLLLICCLVDKLTAALILPLAMGVQNSAANRFNGVALNTVFITGNIQKIGEGLLAWAWPLQGAKRSSSGFAIYALVWIAYAAGAALGALADSMMVAPLLWPALVLPFIMLTPDQSQRLRGHLARSRHAHVRLRQYWVRRRN